MTTAEVAAGFRPVPNEPEPPAPDNGGLTTDVPADDRAERALLSAFLSHGSFSGADVETAMGLVDPLDFHRGSHKAVAQVVFDLHAQGRPTDTVTVAHVLAEVDQSSYLALGGASGLVSLSAEPAGTASSVAEHARIVASCARRRRWLGAAEALKLAAQAGDEEAAGRALEFAQRSLAVTVEAGPDASLDDFLAAPEPEYDWLVPGLLERQDRLILTGLEGGGKTTFYRQFAVQVSAGIHPFTLDDIEPVPVLYVDAENSRRHSRREFRPLRLAVKSRGVDTRPVIETGGIDLLDTSQQRWLMGRVKANKPALVIIGPLYKLASGDPTEEKTARTVALCLDRIRDEFDVAIMLEAHSPHPVGNMKRVDRPYGASLWLRWPEFGLHLANDGQLRHWRGPRDEREWPKALKRGGEWPWTTDASYRTPEDRPMDEMEAVSRFLEYQQEPIGYKELRKKVDGREATKTVAIRLLLDEGYIAKTSKGREKLHHSIKAYRKTDDSLWTESFITTGDVAAAEAIGHEDEDYGATEPYSVEGEAEPMF